MSGCPSTSCWKDSFLRCIAFVPLLKISWMYLWVYLQALYSVPLIYLSILSPKLHCLDYCSCTVSLEMGSINPSILFFIFNNIVFAILGLSSFQSNLNNKFFNTHKIPCWDLIGIVSYYRSRRKIWHLDKTVFLSMHMDYFSIYLVHLWYLLSEFCVFFSYGLCRCVIKFIYKYFISGVLL